MVEKIKTTGDNCFIKIIDYINENATGLGIISAVIIAILSNVLKVFAYVYYSGWFKYFDINKIYINISDKNFYGIAVSASVCIIYFILNYIVYKIIAYQDSKFKLLFGSFVIMGIINIVFIFFNNSYLFSKNDIVPIAIVCFIILPLLEYSFGIYWGIATIIRNRKKPHIQVLEVQDEKDISINNIKNNDTLRNLIIDIVMIMALFSFYVVLFYEIGFFSAKRINTFKIIDNQYVVLYETENDYLSAECTIDSNTLKINKDKQICIDKADIITETMKFNSVK